MLKQLALTAFAAVAASTASAGPRPSDCEEWGCGMNGASLNGVRLTGLPDIARPDRDRFDWLGGCDEWGCGTNGSTLQGVLLNGLTIGSGKPVVDAVILPSGEIVRSR